MFEDPAPAEEPEDYDRQGVAKQTTGSTAGLPPNDELLTDSQTRDQVHHTTRHAAMASMKPKAPTREGLRSMSRRAEVDDTPRASTATMGALPMRDSPIPEALSPGSIGVTTP